MRSPCGSLWNQNIINQRLCKQNATWGYGAATGGVCAGVSYLSSTYSVGEGQFLTLGFGVWLNTHLSLVRGDWKSLCHIYSQPRVGECSCHAQTQGLHLGTEWTTKSFGRSPRGCDAPGPHGSVCWAWVTLQGGRKMKQLLRDKQGLCLDPVIRRCVWLGDLIHGSWAGKPVVRPMHVLL